jgi:hypothetical protein
MHRRRALQLIGALAGVPALPVLGRFSESELLALGTRIHEQLEGEPREPRALTPAQYRQVEVAAEQIIPRTHTPGATDARVADFIDTMLVDWYTPPERARFIAGLSDLDARAMKTHGRAFVDVSSSARVALLTAIDDEVTALRRANTQAGNEHWFATLKFLTVWGYYTSRVGATEELRANVMPGRYDGDAPVALPRRDDGLGKDESMGRLDA